MTERSTSSHCSPSRREEYMQKSCDRCGFAGVTIVTDADPCVQPMNTGDECSCDSCGLTGYVVETGCDGDTSEDCFDIQWIDPETGESWQI